MIILKLAVNIFLQKMLDLCLVPWMELITFLLLSSVFFIYVNVFSTTFFFKFLCPLIDITTVQKPTAV